MDPEQRAEIIRTAAGAVRAPFAIADMQIVRFRGERSRVRLLPQTAISLIDTVTSRLVPDVTARRSTPDAPPAARPTAADSAEDSTDESNSESAEPATTDDPSDPDLADNVSEEDTPLVDEQRQDQLAAERKSREHKATRSNRSLSSMAQDLAVAEAVADAHEQRAREEELTARDFGPQSSS